MYKGYIYRHWIINDKGIEKSYIGQTIQKIERRWRNNGNGYLKWETKFSNAIKKYGWNDFKHDILLTIECKTEEELLFWLDQWEMYYIEKYDSFYNGYNSTLGGGNSPISEEQKQKISDTLKKRYEDGYIHPFLGKHHTEESRKKMGTPRYGEDNSFYGKHHTEEAKEKNRKAHLGKGCVPVICLNTMQVFKTATEAGQWCGLKSSTPITECCAKTNPKRKTSGKHPETKEKLHWMYYKDYLKLQNELNELN